MPNKRSAHIRQRGDESYSRVISRAPLESSDPKRRHHVIMFDGTWNDENGVDRGPIPDVKPISNVALLDRLLGSDSADQVGVYHRGIGNKEDNNTIQQLFTGAFGADERCIRASAFAQLVMTWEPGDILSVFGFSRGAATARMFANDLARYGIPNELEVIYRPWNGEYRVVDCRCVGKDAVSATISFMGLWDTVGSFGLPFDIGPLPFGKINIGKDLDLSPIVSRTVHLMALDEDRSAYDVVRLSGLGVTEIWMPGSHGDVGGGYYYDNLCTQSLLTMLHFWRETMEFSSFPVPRIDVADSNVLPSPRDYAVRHYHDFWPFGRLVRDTLPGDTFHRGILDMISSGKAYRIPSHENGPLEKRAYAPPNFDGARPDDYLLEGPFSW